jgi:hypothetical protein
VVSDRQFLPSFHFEYCLLIITVHELLDKFEARVAARFPHEEVKMRTYVVRFFFITSLIRSTEGLPLLPLSAHRQRATWALGVGTPRARIILVLTALAPRRPFQ